MLFTKFHRTANMSKVRIYVSGHTQILSTRRFGNNRLLHCVKQHYPRDITFMSTNSNTICKESKLSHLVIHIVWTTHTYVTDTS